jgi:hypothetical protein
MTIMKKTYITPAMSVSELFLEGVVAASLQMHDDKTVDTSNGGQLTNKYKSPWDSSNWSN